MRGVRGDERGEEDKDYTFIVVIDEEIGKLKISVNEHWVGAVQPVHSQRRMLQRTERERMREEVRIRNRQKSENEKERE